MKKGRSLRVGDVFVVDLNGPNFTSCIYRKVRRNEFAKLWRRPADGKLIFTGLHPSWERSFLEGDTANEGLKNCNVVIIDSADAGLDCVPVC